MTDYPNLQNTSMTHNSGGDLIEAFLAYNSLLVKQKLRGCCKEFFCNCEARNKYAIYDPEAGNSKILEAMEESSCFCRACCGNLRAFEMGIHTLEDKEVCHYVRPYHGSQGGPGCYGLPLCPCAGFCFQVLDVFIGNDSANAGTRLGYIREEYSLCLPVLTVRNDSDEVLYTIRGECCGCRSYKFHVCDGSSNDAIGTIKKKWSGAVKEFFSDADNFFITFPQGSSATARALLVGATFLIDFLYFENNNDN